MSVVLCMIVKNETAVLRRCLDSVRPFIDSWCIVDTGSTDGTQELARECMKGVPGELLEQPWVRQDQNRTQAMEAAGKWGDYLLCIDADETLEAEPGFEMPKKLTADVYELQIHYGSVRYARFQILRASMPWRWVGRAHPYLTAEGAGKPEPLPGLFTVPHPDGASWGDPLKYQKHVALFEEDCEEHPDNARFRYYLAQSYRDAKAPEMARENYLRRVEMGGWVEETWSAAYEAAKLTQKLGMPADAVVADYTAAWRLRPSRAEPLCALARYLRQRREYDASLLFAKEAARLPMPNDRLFVEWAIYKWQALAELATTAHYAGDALLAAHAYMRVRQQGGDEAKGWLKANAAFLAPAEGADAQHMQLISLSPANL